MATPPPARAGPKILVRKVVPEGPPPPSKDELDSKKVAALLGRLNIAYCDGSVDVRAAVEAAGFAALQEEGLTAKLAAAAADASDPETREAAFLALAQLPPAAGAAAEPYLLPLAPALLAAASDKHAGARAAAAAAGGALASRVTPRGGALLLPALLEALAPLKRWQGREAALRMLAALASAAPAAVAARLPDLVAPLADCLNDARDAVREAAAAAGRAAYALVGNVDLAPLTDDLLHCVARPEEVEAVVERLGATTFVQVRFFCACVCCVCCVCLACALCVVPRVAFC